MTLGLVIHLVDGSRLTVDDLDEASALDLAEELADPDGPRFVQLTMDGDIVHVPVARILYVELGGDVVPRQGWLRRAGVRLARVLGGRAQA